MTGKFRKVLEIGCFNGHSTSAFVQAINDGARFDLHLCDIRWQAALRRVVGMCDRPATFHKKKSLVVIDRTYDLVLVDGDHTYENVKAEVELLARHQTETVIAHDTGNVNDSNCAGAVYLADYYRRQKNYFCLEDAKARPGERTHRGFFFATRNPDLYLATIPLFAGVDTLTNLTF